jgi:DNA-binding transcriptional regulator YiaG
MGSYHLSPLPPAFRRAILWMHLTTRPAPCESATSGPAGFARLPGLHSEDDQRKLSGMTPEQIFQLRKRLDITQTDLARVLGLRHKSQVAHLESGRTPATGPVLRLLSLLASDPGKRILKKLRTGVDVGKP